MIVDKRSVAIEAARSPKPSMSTRRRRASERSRSRSTPSFQCIKFRIATTGLSVQKRASASLIGTSEAVRITNRATPRRADIAVKRAGSADSVDNWTPDVSPAAATRMEARVEMAAEVASVEVSCRSTSAFRPKMSSFCACIASRWRRGVNTF